MKEKVPKVENYKDYHHQQLQQQQNYRLDKDMLMDKTKQKSEYRYSFWRFRNVMKSIKGGCILRKTRASFCLFAIPWRQRKIARDRACCRFNKSLLNGINSRQVTEHINFPHCAIFSYIHTKVAKETKTQFAEKSPVRHRFWWFIFAHSSVVSSLFLVSHMTCALIDYSLNQHS